MAKTALSVVGGITGAIIGLPFGAPALGAQIGFLAGGAIGGAVFPEKHFIEGPRLADLDFQSSAHGLPIAVVFGTKRLAGNVIWATQIKETRKETRIESGGGKGGGSEQVAVSFTYSVDMAVAICEGPIVGIRKVWADTKLVYNSSTDASVGEQIASLVKLRLEIEGGSTQVLNTFAPGAIGSALIYKGTQTQDPDPTIETDKGVGDVPAYRGLAYIVFDELQLANFGNRIPNFTFEVVFSGSSSFAEIGKATLHKPVEGSPAPGNPRSVCFWGMDDNGETIYYATSFSTSGYLGDRSTAGRISGENNFPIPRPAPPSGPLPSDNILRDTANASAGARLHSDEPALIAHNVALGGEAQSGWLYLYNQARWIKIDGNHRNPSTGGDQGVPAIAVAKRAGEILVSDFARCSVFSSDGAFQFQFPQHPTTFTAGCNDVGISDNFFWVNLGQSRIERWTKSGVQDLVIDVQSLSGVGVAIDVHDDNLIFHCHRSSSSQLEVSRIEIINGSPVITSVTGGQITMSDRIQTNLFHQTFFVKGSLIVFGGPRVIPFQPTPPAGIHYIGPTLTSNSIPLSDVVTTICTKSGLKPSDIDVTALTSDNVSGYALVRDLNARESLAPLQRAFHFDGVESDGKIKFVKRGGSSIETIPETQLAARAIDAGIPDLLTTRRVSEKELPSTVEIGYSNPAMDHQQGMQRATRLITKSDSVADIELAISMTDDEARQIADIALYEAWLSRSFREVKLSRRYLFLDPTDVVTVTTALGTFIIRIEEMTFGEPGVLILRGFDDAGAVFSSTATGGAADPRKTPPGLIGSTYLRLLDLPLLRDVDNGPGFYAAARGFSTVWPGCVLFRSPDGGETFSEMMPMLNATPAGEVVSILASGPTTVFDEVNTVTVSLIGGTLTSDTEINVLNGANACAIGSEVLQFKTATLNADGFFVFSGLLRARRGTEQHIGTHAVGNVFVLLQSSTLERTSGTLADLNIERIFKAPTIGLSLFVADPSAFTNTGAGLKPLSPVHIKSVRNVPATDDITISWVRRTRIGPEWRDLVDVPLGEATESYSIDIFNNGTVVRTLTSTSESVVYTAAQNATDFVSVQASVHVKVYQISADVGRGFPGDAPAVFETTAIPPSTATLTLLGAAPAASPLSVIIPSDGSLSIVGLVPGLNRIVVPSASLALTGNAPALNRPVIPAGSLAIIGAPPTQALRNFIPVGSLTLAGAAPTVIGQRVDILVPVGSLTVLGAAPIAKGDGEIIVPQALLTFVGNAPVLNRIIVPGGSLTIVGDAPQIPPFVITVPAGSLTIVGIAPGVTEP